MKALAGASKEHACPVGLHPNAQIQLHRVPPSKWVIAIQNQDHASSNHGQFIQSFKRKDAGEGKVTSK